MKFLSTYKMRVKFLIIEFSTVKNFDEIFNFKNLQNTSKF